MSGYLNYYPGTGVTVTHILTISNKLANHKSSISNLLHHSEFHHQETIYHEQNAEFTAAIIKSLV